MKLYEFNNNNVTVYIEAYTRMKAEELLEERLDIISEQFDTDITGTFYLVSEASV